MEPKTDVDDAYWKYQYDVRYRLTQAQQYNSSNQLLYTFNYTYDKAGNMLTKSEVIPQGGSYYYSYEHNAANELTTQTQGGTATNFYYDASGRMMSKTQGSATATYEYRYGDKLKSVTSNFSGEGNVTYEYGRRLAVESGDLKRRKRQDSSATRQYNWDAGWNVISEENGCGTLTMTYVHDPGKVIGTILADVSGDDPSTGTYRYYFQDNIGSTRRLRNDSKTSLGSYEYTPYGRVYLESGATIRYKFTGQEWDDTAKVYYFPFRYYSPALAGWLTEDPLGMADGLNVYDYAGGNPVSNTDPTGGRLYTPREFANTWIKYLKGKKCKRGEERYFDVKAFLKCVGVEWLGLDFDQKTLSMMGPITQLGYHGLGKYKWKKYGMGRLLRRLGGKFGKRHAAKLIPGVGWVLTGATFVGLGAKCWPTAWKCREKCK